ncbi:hypothetical protein BC826DRAFT_1108289 [Russula brevipes]|nr:hypothetical protein BC826DRAFT_1108289 [Russula brevipes]
MSQAAADIEKGDDTGILIAVSALLLSDSLTGRRALSRRFQFGDSSGPLFSMYSKTMMDEDVTGAERCQKDADAVLIFAGLFSATVGALLTVSLQDLRQNPQISRLSILRKSIGFLPSQRIQRVHSFHRG